MNMHPWLMEQMVVSHIEDLRRLAGVDRVASPTTRSASTSTGAISRHFGELLIRAGQRLVGPDPLAQSAALGLARRGVNG